MKTIAHYLSGDIKINQDFKYRQITGLNKYRSIVIGDFQTRESEREYPYHYFYIGHIADWPAFIKEHHIKAIHAHFGRDAPKILPTAIRYNIPLIVSFRGNDASAQKKAIETNRLNYQGVIEYGSLFLPVCEFFKQELIKLGFQENKIKILYGGIDINKFSYRKSKKNTDKAFRILSVGRLVEKKGFPVLIRAFRKVHHRFPKSKLVIVGEGKKAQRMELLREIEKYHLDKSVTLKKAIRNDEIVKEYHRADLFCLPSHTTSKGAVEGIPNVLKEAMSCGVPVVSTYHAGIPELIEHKRTGILVKEKDDKALAKAMIQLLEDSKQAQEYAKRARKKVKKDFNLHKQIQIQEQYYDDLIQDQMFVKIKCSGEDRIRIQSYR